MEAQNYLFIQHVLYCLGDSRISGKTLTARLMTLIRLALFKNKSRAEARNGPADKYFFFLCFFSYDIASWVPNLHFDFTKGSIALGKCML